MLILLNMIQLILYSLVLTIDVKNVEIKKNVCKRKNVKLASCSQYSPEHSPILMFTPKTRDQKYL